MSHALQSYRRKYTSSRLQTGWDTSLAQTLGSTTGISARVGAHP